MPQSLVGEIINGDVVSHPGLSPRHARTAMALGAILFNEFDASPSDEESNWWILNNPTTHLRDDDLVSSIAGWRKKTIPTFPDTKGFNIRPDWVCEVISPLSARYGRAAKRDIYAREGVSHFGPQRRARWSTFYCFGVIKTVDQATQIRWDNAKRSIPAALCRNDLGVGIHR